MQCDQVRGEKKIRVLVADNSQIHAQSLVTALARDNMLEAESSGCESNGLIAAAVARGIDVLVTSSNLDDQPGRGLQIVRELRTIRPQVHAIVLLDSSKSEIIADAFRAGARGVFSKNGSIEALCKCIRCVSQGQVWANSEELVVALKALASTPTVRAVSANGLNLLSKRESQVVQCLAEGFTNREIARHLGLSQHTVKNYLFRIFDKLGVSNRVELLFMSLSQDGNSQPVNGYSLQGSTNVAVADETTLTELQTDAEQGSPMAQLALAHLYLAQSNSPDHLMRAYTWYLVAREQISRTLESNYRLMRPEQVAEAKRRAASWLNKVRKPATSASEDDPPVLGSVASAD